MKPQRAWMLPVGLLLITGRLGYSVESNGRYEGAVAQLRKLGRRLKIGKRSPGSPVVGADLSMTRGTNAALVRLKGLPNLQYLGLLIAHITDAGPAHWRAVLRSVYG